MIDSRETYFYYLEADRIALKRKKIRIISKAYWVGLISPDYIWKFQKRLRKYEYYLNTSRTILSRIISKVYYLRYRKLAIKLGFSIPPNVFGPGMAIAHYGTIIVNKFARVGANCRIHAGVNIGTEAGSEDKAPVIGDNVYIGPGAKIFGAIVIADNIAIGANAVVNKSFNTPCVSIGGIPAKEIGTVKTEQLLVIATAFLEHKESSE